MTAEKYIHESNKKLIINLNILLAKKQNMLVFLHHNSIFVVWCLDFVVQIQLPK